MDISSLLSSIGWTALSFLIIYVLAKIISFLIKNKRENDEEKKKANQFYLAFGNRPQGTSQRTVDETLRKFTNDLFESEKEQSRILSLIRELENGEHFQKNFLEAFNRSEGQNYFSIDSLKEDLVLKVKEKAKRLNNARELARQFEYNTT